MRTGNIEIRMEVINQYGERFAIEQEIAEEDMELSEIKTYHKAYLKFLSAAGFAVDSFNEVAILDEGEYVETYCDGDCENCDEDDDEDDYIDDDDDDDYMDIDEAISEALKDHAEEIADLVAKEFSKAAQTRGYRALLNPID